MDPKKIRTQKGDATVSTTNHTVPSGTELVFRSYQALRTWLPSFSPFGTTKRQYRPHFRRPDGEAVSKAAPESLLAKRSAVDLERKHGRFLGLPHSQ